MAEEIESIWNLVGEKNNFLLSGGAGSGKTHTLIELLNKIYKENPKSKVACITYTNSAVSTIKKRAPFDRLSVMTLHNFLWEQIRNYQKNLKDELVVYCVETDKEIDPDEIKQIKYREWRSLRRGVISHDEVLILAEKLFENHKRLCDIVKDKYDFILVDEYQDTFPSTVKILLDHLPKSSKDLIIGFFGDSMQNIYDEGVGSLETYLTSGDVSLVQKQDNYRSPSKVISLINKIRDDGLEQIPADDATAHNYQKDGEITFLYSMEDEISIEKIKSHLAFERFKFDDPVNTKELYLVHRLIADQAGFGTLYDIYNGDNILKYVKGKFKKYIDDNQISFDDDTNFRTLFEAHKDETRAKLTKGQKEYIEKHQGAFEFALDQPFQKLLSIHISSDDLLGSSRSKIENDPKAGNKRDALSQHLFHIEECIELYKDNNFNKFVNKTNFEIRGIADKALLKSAIEELTSLEVNSIHEVIEKAHELQIWKKTEKLEKFIEEKSYTYNRVKDVSYKEWKSVFDNVEQFTIYSTQHSIKGEEYDNVFVMLDNGNWNKFNFQHLFENTAGKESIIKRTMNLFYVCCSRTMESLVVFYHKPSDAVLTKARELFGENRVMELDD